MDKNTVNVVWVCELSEAHTFDFITGEGKSQNKGKQIWSYEERWVCVFITGEGESQFFLIVGGLYWLRPRARS